MEEHPEPMPEGERTPPPGVPWTAIGTDDGKPRTIVLCLDDKETQSRLADGFEGAGWQVIEVRDPADALKAALQHKPRYLMTDSTTVVMGVDHSRVAIPGTHSMCLVDGLKVSPQDAWDAGADMIVYPFEDAADLTQFRIVRRR